MKNIRKNIETQNVRKSKTFFDLVHKCIRVAQKPFYCKKDPLVML